ncbi:thioredoxin domain-containing protein [Allosphingosinicella flava]|uniref:Thioredoxin domain-containing protein n=2 Tax=Allosphingosinicella flava TaxID=2771430 RepID=A0A7T2GJI8_9SPHN|nr:thioredoxin domain-containing protein [Sphingosinicella flava]
MILAAGLVGVLLGASAMALAPGAPVSGQDRAAIEKIVHDYILAHPEIIPEAMERLQAREIAKVVDANRKAIETPFAGAWAGAADGDVVLVEFFDYACGYCRASQPDVERLLKEDKKLKVVWREFPVLGEDSRKAALVSLAAAEAGKYKAFHDKLFALGRPSPDAVKSAQAAAGTSASPSASPRFDAEIEKNYDLARALSLTGTPAFIVGGKVLQGAVGYDALKDAIVEARAKK